MSIESVRAFFAEKAPDIAVIESTMSSATVTLAAEAYGVEPARIAKTLSLRIGERVVLIVAAGTSRMDNKKVKAQFGGKPKMLGLDEVAEITGQPDYLWVALGIPYEQAFVEEYTSRLSNVGVIKTSGGLFNFLSGSRVRYSRRRP